MVWSPYQLGMIWQLQQIQDKFFGNVGVKMGFDGAIAMDRVEEAQGLKSLNARRKLQDVIFLKKILNGDIDCLEYIGLIDIKVPSRTRSLDLYSILLY